RSGRALSPGPAPRAGRRARRRRRRGSRRCALRSGVRHAPLAPRAFGATRRRSAAGPAGARRGAAPARRRRPDAPRALRRRLRPRGVARAVPLAAERREGRGMSERVIALRHAFDEAFRRAAHELADDRARLLRLRVGGDAYAFRLDEIASFAAARRIVPLASAVPGLLGLAGLRGTLVPVYSLAALLGRAADDEAPRWFVLCGGAEPVALAFARFEGYVETARGELRG